MPQAEGPAGFESQPGYNPRPVIDLDSIDLSPVLEAAESFLVCHGEYHQFVTAHGGDQPEASLALFGDVVECLQALDRALASAGLYGGSLRSTGPNPRAGYVDLLRKSVGELTRQVPRELYLEQGNIFVFRADSVEMIRLSIDKLRQRSPGKEQDRLRVDDASRTIWIDGRSVCVEDGVTFRLIRALIEAQQEGETPLSRLQLARRAGMRGEDLRLNRYFKNYLPAWLNQIIQSKGGPNGGYSLLLPPVP
jgi:hypothetical protein